MYGKHYAKEKSSHISYRQIIQCANQLDLWSWFLGYRVELGEFICNPMRIDSHPNCWLSWGLIKQDFIVLNDFACRTPFHGFTIFDAVMYQYNLTFDKAIQKVYEEFILMNNIQLTDKPDLQPKRRPKFEFKLNYVPWTLNGKEVYTKHDKTYWQQYGISSQELKEDNVKSNRRVIFNSKSKPHQFTALDTIPSYTYLFGEHKKCYQPYHDLKWLSTCTEEDVGGWNTMTNDNLIITKSYKDWRVLKNSGYNTIWLQNEGCKIPFDKLIKLQDIPTKYILFDNDVAGKTASHNLADYCNQFDNSYIPVYFDDYMPDDSAELVKQFGYHVLEQEILNLGIQ